MHLKLNIWLVLTELCSVFIVFLLLMHLSNSNGANKCLNESSQGSFELLHV